METKKRVHMCTVFGVELFIEAVPPEEDTERIRDCAPGCVTTKLRVVDASGGLLTSNHLYDWYGGAEYGLSRLVDLCEQYVDVVAAVFLVPGHKPPVFACDRSEVDADTFVRISFTVSRCVRS